ncbi:hypothetical protein Q9295_15655 [Xinfangfangia sp. CPCC 101601]|uniref:Uncharacterized protein n=1 Tax=Pseudogemmobacter lacusdianii TaxID=3069608 RepID=A0ABU0W213_9RHOB|nr:hypothetical protein [Xinfangfangia sp. CPCC 101601]MDQ2067813.1 hypothetical protein [Xinfangfangia sp. CPCC 101601]
MITRKVIAATLLATLMGGAAYAKVDQIAKVDVTVDLTAIQNEKAVAYWGNIEKDLEAAIGARVGDLMAEEGADVLVDIREVELANAFERELNLGDAVLVGQVNINDQTDNSNYDAYELSVSLENAAVILPEGTTTLMLSTTDTDESYRKLIDAFAEGVVSRLK